LPNAHIKNVTRLKPIADSLSLGNTPNTKQGKNDPTDIPVHLTLSIFLL
jgi:hypothetical protein